MSNISYYSNAKATKGETTEIDFFLSDVKNGRWQNAIIDYKTGLRMKESLPAVTLSGLFSTRKASEIIKHSGFICIDIDKLGDSVHDVMDVLKSDEFVYAVWRSVSGLGLAVLFKIDPRAHLKAFLGLSEYLYKTYNIIVDQSGKDVSRLRFVSYDPELYINESAAKFTKYPTSKSMPSKRMPKYIFVQNDFESIVAQILSRNLDIVNDYHDWLNVGLALADKFGESGRQYFHDISQIGNKYKFENCEKQYNACLRSGRGEITIATFYWMCKRYGISLMSEKTQLIAATASNAKKGGRDIKGTVRLLKKLEGIEENESLDIIEQVFNGNVELQSDSFIFQLETFIRQNYDIRRNEVTQYLELNGERILDEDFNSIYIDAKKVFENNISFELINRLIVSNFTPNYNPFIEWIDANKTRITTGSLDRLCKTIISDMDYAYIEKFVKKWMVGIIETIFEKPTPLMLILSGSKQNTGKTEWFRRLLPDDLKKYYAESQLDRGKDDEILMTQRLIIMNDEMGGKAKEDERRMKNILSKQMFTLRKPYGKGDVDLRRLAVMAGTSNDDELLNDPTGNRRFIPINVLDIDKDLYNSINKTELLIEAYWLWKEGRITAEMTNAEIDYLNKHTQNFNEVSIEGELIQKWFQPGGNTFLTNTDIKVFLEHISKQKLSSRKIGLELRRLGFERTTKRVEYEAIRKGYMVYELNRTGVGHGEPPF